MCEGYFFAHPKINYVSTQLHRTLRHSSPRTPQTIAKVITVPPIEGRPHPYIYITIIIVLTTNDNNNSWNMHNILISVEYYRLTSFFSWFLSLSFIMYIDEYHLVSSHRKLTANSGSLSVHPGISSVMPSRNTGYRVYKTTLVLVFIPSFPFIS